MSSFSDEEHKILNENLKFIPDKNININDNHLFLFVVGCDAILENLYHEAENLSIPRINSILNKNVKPISTNPNKQPHSHPATFKLLVDIKNKRVKDNQLFSKAH